MNICIKAEFPDEVCKIDDELKAIYHSIDTVYVWTFKTRDDRNRFMNETISFNKKNREKHYNFFYK